METIREWISHLTPSQKKKPSKAIVDNLFKVIETELHSTSPDYDVCVLALTAFSRPVRKQLKSMLKIKDATNKRSTQTELFALIAVARREDTKTFDVAVDMFDIDSTF